MKKIRGIDINKMAIYFIIIAEIVYFGFIIVSRAKYIDSYMVNDFSNSEMDFFNMLAVTGRDDPYCEAANYPAMCFLILKFFHRLIPSNMAYSDNVHDGNFLRTYMPTQIAYTVFTLCCIIAVYEMVKKMFNGYDKDKTILAISMILSGPMIFTVERGNFILLAFLFSMIYILFYDSDNRYLRFISYVALALAASIKIYPAVLGLLTIIKKRYKETIILICLGIAFFILPFFYFNGIESILSMLNGLSVSGDMQGNFGTGYNFSISNFVKIVGLFCGQKSIQNEVISVVRIFSIVLCFIVCFVSKELWKKTYALILIMVWTPEFSYTYSLIFLIIPFIMLLNQKKKNIIENICLYLLCMNLIPYSIPGLNSIDVINAKLPLTTPTLIINVVIFLIFIMIFIDDLKILLMKYKTKEII